MTTPTLMTILSAPSSSATPPSAVAGAELPGPGAGFACLVQMLLDQQHEPAPPVPGGDAIGKGANGRDDGLDPTAVGAVPAAGAETVATDAAVAVGGAAGLVTPPAASGARLSGRAGDVPSSSAPVDSTQSSESSESPEPPEPPEPSKPEGGEGETSMSAQVAATVGAPAPVASVAVAAAADEAADQPADGTAPATTAVPDRHVPGPTARDAADGSASTTARTAGATSTGVAAGTNGTTSTAPTAHDTDAAPGRAAAAATTATTAATAHAAADQTQVPPATTVGVVAPASNATHTTSGPAPAAGPVAGQVFPEVVRMVTRGDGTQRLTLRLSPENLGEVRIVVTVRDGGVEVRLAAGADAQNALRHGTADLRRLLESIGATSTQVVVRDLPGAATSTFTATSAAQPAGTGAGSTYADTNGGHAHDQQHGGDASMHQPGHHQTAGPGHDDVRPLSAAPTAPAAAAGLDLRL